MNVFSLRTVIDDILLIVRNNNISESEDLSRDQIRAWVLAYRAYLAKKQQDKKEENGDDTDSDDSLSITIGPLALQTVKSSDNCRSHSKKTKEKLPALIGGSADNIVSVSDDMGNFYQIMDAARRQFQGYRRYTHCEPTARYDDGYIYLDGAVENAHYIYVYGNFADGDEVNGSEDDVTIPGWMIPDIKKAIMDNELAFMLKRPSDDSNNSTLASVKPHGPQDKEK